VWHGTDRVSWRFVLYDSNYRVVDSTSEIYNDSGAVTLLGPGVISTIPLPPLAPHDITYWPVAASFFMVTGPRTQDLGFVTIPVVSGGCAFKVNISTPALDRSGWMLQRTEHGQRINMFSDIGGNNYDGKYNDFPYRVTIGGISYPTAAQSDRFNYSYNCGTTQGSCQMAPMYN
jgi:hypothetical protein